LAHTLLRKVISGINLEQFHITLICFRPVTILKISFSQPDNGVFVVWRLFDGSPEMESCISILFLA